MILTGLAKLLFPIVKAAIAKQVSNKAAYWLLDEACDILVAKRETNHNGVFKKKVKHIAKLHR